MATASYIMYTGASNQRISSCCPIPPESRTSSDSNIRTLFRAQPVLPLLHSPYKSHSAESLAD